MVVANTNGQVVWNFFVVVLTAGIIVGCENVPQQAEKEIPDPTIIVAPNNKTYPLSSKSAEPAYRINGKLVQLNKADIDGKTSLLTLINGDLNNDGQDDKAVILVQNSVGSGVLYYINVFITDKNNGWRLVLEEFLGDRIKFDSLDIYNKNSVSSITKIPIHPNDYGQLLAAFFVRSSEQPFTDKPNLYITKHWKMKGDRLVVIENY